MPSRPDLDDNEEFHADLLNPLLTRASICEKWNCSAGYVSSRRSKTRASAKAEAGIAGDDALASYMDDRFDPEKGASYTRMAATAWGEDDWREFLRLKGTDPDSVTFTFGVTSNPHGGYWNKLLNVRPRPVGLEGLIDAAEIAAHRAKVAGWALPRVAPAADGDGVAIVLNMSDFQLFKSEGGGVDATLERIYGGLTRFVAKLDHLREIHNIEEIVLVNNGDPFEGIAGNYASQTHTVQGGLRAQMNLVIDVWLRFAKELFPRFKKAQFVSVLCNHTEFGRQGGAKNSITSDSDNGSAFLAEVLEKILAHAPGFEHVSFVIPHDEMSVYTTAAGVPMGFNHGHKIPGNDAGGFEKWLNGQVRGDDRAHEAKIWVTAHRHNFQAWDLGSTFGFSCPSCDGGSKWLRDATGKFSRAGMISFIVDRNHPLHWSDVAFH